MIQYQEKKNAKVRRKKYFDFYHFSVFLCRISGWRDGSIAVFRSRNTAKEFTQALGGKLKKQLEAGGAESAIGICKYIAPAMAAEYSKDGRVVKRVSLKNRNPSLGVPDKWEREVLESFDRDYHEGKPATDMEKTAIIETSDGRWFRYMKAIPTQPMCLQCHGTPEDISEGVKALLAKEYPEDKATGYRAGEIRGAVSIKQRM